MNQTDWQGETERALRADILGAVARGWCSPKNAAKVMDADLANAITAELLPLFNAGMELAKAAVLRESARTLEKGIPQMSVVEFLETMALYHDGEAGRNPPSPFVALAIALAALSTKTEHIAKEGAFTPVGQELMSKDKEELVRIISATREDEEWFRNRANELTVQVETHAAAIASAEARARLEEHLLTCTDCFDDKRGKYCCGRRLELEQALAARTPTAPRSRDKMQPMSPVLPSHPELSETVIAKNQPPYKPLVGVFNEDELITRWQLSWRERLQVLLHGSVWLRMLTFRRPVTPVSIETREP